MWRASIPGALLCAPPTTHMSRLRVATCALVGRVTILSPLPCAPPIAYSRRSLLPDTWPPAHLRVQRTTLSCNQLTQYNQSQPNRRIQFCSAQSNPVATRSTHNVDGAHHTANDFHSAGTCLLWQSPPPADVITRPPNNRVNTLTLIQPSGRLARQPLMHLYISVALGTSALELIGCGQLLASSALYLLVRSTPHPARISNFKPALKN